MEYPKKGRYRHFKGGEYELLYFARNSETDEPMVVYKALYECGETPLGERIWVRPLSMWQETVDRDGYHGPRFIYVGVEDEVPMPTDEDAPCGEPIPEQTAVSSEEPAVDPMEKARAILREVYGYADFRPGQEQAISSILSGKEVLGVMPTGAGKSLCYQIPALVLNGTALVISPLISLMKDQVEALRQSGVSAAYLNTSLTETQISAVLARILQGKYKIVYVAPERLLTERFLYAVSHIPLSLIAVDEAHCISQWGQDFRPSYLDIAEFIDRLPARPRLCAFTATATEKVREDIKKLLGMNTPVRIVTGFDRPNLYFSVVRPANRMTKLLELMQTYSDMSGIVYCATRKTVEEVCDALTAKGIRATRYHAGLSEEERRANQDAFSMDEIPVMVATNAFGMGIDKSNVRFVIHYNLPKDMESYYQEAGRAGRDGMRADCVLMYSTQDLTTQSYFIDHIGEEAGMEPAVAEQLKKTARRRLNAMKKYAAGGKCLRGEMLRYFGEQAPERCGRCAVCDGLIRTCDASDSARTALACIRAMRTSFGAGVICQVLKGSSSSAVLQRGLNNNPCYGALSQMSIPAIGDLLEAMTDEGILRKTVGEYPVLLSGPNAEKLRAGEVTVQLCEEPVKTTRTRSGRTARTAPVTGTDRSLYEKLRKLRQAIAKEKGTVPFMIFSDAALNDMASRRPHTAEEFLQVSGVGKAKCSAYGDRFLSCIADWEASEK